MPSLYIRLAEIGGKVRVLTNLSSFLDRRGEGIGVPVGNALLFIDSDQVWAATIKKRTNDNQDENAPVGAGRREGVARA